MPGRRSSTNRLSFPTLPSPPVARRNDYPAEVYLSVLLRRPQVSARHPPPARAEIRRWFEVVHATMFDGDGFAAKSAVFRAHIAGPPDLAKKLFDLPEGTRVHVEGAIERRSHTFLLGVVNPVHAAPTQQ